MVQQSLGEEPQWGEDDEFSFGHVVLGLSGANWHGDANSLKLEAQIHGTNLRGVLVSSICCKNYPRGLTQYTLIVLKLQRSEVCNRSPWSKVKVLAGLQSYGSYSSGAIREMVCFLAFSRFQMPLASLCLWILPPYSKQETIALSYKDSCDFIGSIQKVHMPEKSHWPCKVIRFQWSGHRPQDLLILPVTGGICLEVMLGFTLCTKGVWVEREAERNEE